MNCKTCSLTFSEIKEFIDHIGIHFDPQKPIVYICDHVACHRIFSNRYKFSEHLFEHKIKKINEKVHVPIVPLVINSVDHLEHVVDNLPNSDFSFLPSNCDKYQHKIILIKIILKYLSKKNNTRKMIFEFSGDVLSFMNEILSAVFENIKSLNIDFRPELFDFRRFIDCNSKNISEHKFCGELKKLNILIPFKEIIFQDKPDKKSMTLIDIKYLLSELFRNQNFSTRILSFLNELENNTELIQNIMQTSFWKNLTKDSEKDVLWLPIFFYNDDFEGLNALGAHATAYSINASYIKLGALPPELNSKISFIFPLAFCYAKDLNEFSVNVVFKEVITMLNDLYDNGIDITVANYTKIKFIVTNILADNKGSSSILNFVCNFSTTKYFCRFCKHDKEEIKKITEIDNNKLRTSANYKEDIILNNYKLTGIRGETVFSQLRNFDVVDNSVSDFMHDIAEGVVSSDICQIILAFIGKKYFSLDYLNNRMRSFKYNQDIKNRPDNITLNNLKSLNLKFTASEAIVFVVHLNLIIGEKIPLGDEHWRLYILLREIIRLVTSSTHESFTAKILSQVIAEHNKLYVRLFGATQKYKTHLLLHYSVIMNRFGPLNQFSNFRYESKHSEFVKTTQNSCNKINIPKTLAIKVQFQSAYLLLKLEDYIKVHIESKHELQNDFLLLNVINYFETSSTDVLRECSSVAKNGRLLRKKGIFELLSDNQYSFGEIYKIICKNNDIFILYKHLIHSFFDTHLDCFSFEGIDSDVFCLSLEEVNVKKIYYSYEVDGHKYFNNF